MSVNVQPFVAIARVLIIAAIVSAGDVFAATAQTTALYFDSQQGDYVGQGQQLTTTSAVATFSAMTVDGLTRIVVEQGPTSSWYLQFGATDGMPLAVGSYRTATAIGLGFNVLNVFGNSRACGDSVGWFRVLEVEYDSSGGVRRFAADFEQHCGSVIPALFGAIRYNSTVSSLVPFDGHYPDYSLTVTPASGGSVTGTGISCGSGSAACSVRFPESAGAALTAIPDAGYQLLSWEGDCEGGEVAVVNVNGPKVCTPVFGPIVPPQPRSTLVFDSLANPLYSQFQREYVGQGEEQRYSDANSRITVTEISGENFLRFTIDGSGDHTWSLYLRAPNNAAITAGDYSNAIRAAISGSAPGLDFFGDGRGCNTLTGHFVVYESTFANDGTLASFAADFEQHCEGLPLPLYGAIRYHSSYADVIPFGGSYSVYRLNVVISPHARITGPISCSTAPGYICTAGFASPSAVPLTAIPDTGYYLSHWSGACSGTALGTTAAVNARNVVCDASFATFRLASFGADVPMIVSGSQVTFAATITPQIAAEYEFWRYDAGSGWTVVQPYGPASAYSWVPTVADVGSHSIQVWVRSAGSTVAYDDWRAATFEVSPGKLPVITSFSADHPYPLTFGSGPITWTVSATPGLSAPEYEFWRFDVDGWHVVQLYDARNTFTWSPTATDFGSHAIQVWVRDVGSAAQYEAWEGTTFAVIAPALSIASFTANHAPNVGQATTWTAQTTGGLAGVIYQFWRLDSDGWHMVQDYSTNASYTWTPATTDIGNHALQVWVKNSGSFVRYETWSGVSFVVPVPAPAGVTIATLGSIPAAGQGTVTWKATATGGIAPYQYRFWRLDADGWHIAQDYSATDSYTWSPGVSDSGTHAVQAWVRIAGSASNYDAWVSTGYFTVPIPPPITVSFSAAPALPATPGGPLTWTAATSTPSVEYEFWRYDEGGGWTMVQAYGPSASYSWTPDVSDLGTHALQVWVRRVGSVAAYDGWIGTGYFIVSQP